MKKGKVVKAWAGFTDGKLYRYFGTPFNETAYKEYCIYKTRRQARAYFDDVRRVEIREIKPKKRKK